jgi:hypothetical protein
MERERVKPSVFPIAPPSLPTREKERKEGHKNFFRFGKGIKEITERAKKVREEEV